MQKDCTCQKKVVTLLQIKRSGTANPTHTTNAIGTQQAVTA
jgi:hypothetical protein